VASFERDAPTRLNFTPPGERSPKLSRIELAPMSAHARKWLTGFGALGLAASAVATWVHYQLLTNPAYSSFCDINATVSCKQAYLSRYGSIAGVPVAAGGVIFFALVLLLIWAGGPRSQSRDSAPGYIFALSTLGLAVVLYLAYASFFILKEVCPLCVTTYLAVIGVFVVAGGASALPMSRLPGRALRDIQSLVSRPAALVIAMLFLVGAGSLLVFFPRAQQGRIPQPPALALTKDQRPEFERWWEMQDRVELPYANEGAKVLVVKFNDYQCPPCKQTYFGYESILAKHSSAEVRYLMKHFPLDPACNPSVSRLIHPAACDAAVAAEIARSKGTFDKMTEWFFGHQEELSPSTVRRAAKEIGGITDFDAEYPAALQKVKADGSAGAALGVQGTPTFFINGRRIRVVLPPQYFEAALDIELKRASGKPEAGRR
jgi:uncharacterized membrane protein/predicted DsbA family dithiol-disulfide isomerase